MNRRQQKMNTFGHITKRFFSKSYNDDDLKKLFLWYNSRKGHHEINSFLDDAWEAFEAEDITEVDSRKMLASVKKRINRSRSFSFKKNIRPFLPYAAMLAMVIAGFWYIQSIRKTEVLVPEPVVASHTSVITENGQHSRIVLPDSSVVWLNSGTTLSYPSGFSGRNRKVKLQGQAFFQVAHNENNPFSVQTNGLVVTVMGTKFDVDAFPENSEIVVMLESGKVELTHPEFDAFRYIMKPGELATYNLTDKSMNISHTDAAVYSSWKDGKLIFRNSSMKNVIGKLKRWYNVDIKVTDPEVYQSIFTGTIQNESYEEIFRLIEIACPVDCRVIHNYEKEAKPEIIISKNR